MMQDSIDFGTMNIPKLFRMMFIPTLLGMILSATINIADGIFVGRGVGNDALAAVNIVAPFFMTARSVTYNNISSLEASTPSLVKYRAICPK